MVQDSELGILKISIIVTLCYPNLEMALASSIALIQSVFNQVKDLIIHSALKVELLTFTPEDRIRKTFLGLISLEMAPVPFYYTLYGFVI